MTAGWIRLPVCAQISLGSTTNYSKSKPTTKASHWLLDTQNASWKKKNPKLIDFL